MFHGFRVEFQIAMNYSILGIFQIFKLGYALSIMFYSLDVHKYPPSLRGIKIYKGVGSQTLH